MADEANGSTAKRVDRRASRVKGGRTATRTVKLSDAEEVVLISRARSAGMSDAAFLRVSALRGDAGGAEQVAALRSVAREVSLVNVQLHRVGNNLNQLATRANTGVDVRELEGALRGDLARVRELAAELDGVLAQLRGRL